MKRSDGRMYQWELTIMNDGYTRDNDDQFVMVLKIHMKEKNKESEKKRIKLVNPSEFTSGRLGRLQPNGVHDMLMYFSSFQHLSILSMNGLFQL
jgi:hypothetical protein